jgi:glycosyltransferase involved in cell wall biosynthesis
MGFQLRILMISDVHFPRVNGVSTSIQTFQQELSNIGHDVHLVAPAYHADHAPSDDISRIESRAVLLDPEDRFMKARKIYDLLPHFRARNFDLIHIQTPFLAHYAGLNLSRALGIPCVETYHTFFEEYLYHYVPLLPKFLTRSITRRFSRAQCNAVNAVIVPSTAMRNVLQDYGCQTPIHISPTGIPLQNFAAGDGPAFRAKYGIAQDRPVLVHIGRVAHEKNIGFLLHMVLQLKATHPDILFVICGEGPAQKPLQQQAQQLGLQDNVRFIGYLDRNTDLLNCYCAADVFVFASRTETQGLVLLEAMALGVPVVSTAVMGTIDIVEPQRGALKAEEDPVDFASKVSLLLCNPGMRMRMGEEGRAFAQSWGAPATAQRLLQIYQSMLPQAAPLLAA